MEQVRRPRHELAHHPVGFAVSGEDDVVAEVPVAVTAGPAPLAGYRRIDRDPFPAPRAVRDLARTLVPRYQRPGDLGVADGAFGVPVQVRAADANRGNPHEALTSCCFGRRLLPDPQVRRPVKPRRSHALTLSLRTTPSTGPSRTGRAAEDQRE